MRLENYLYQKISESADGSSFSVALISDCEIFKAHFVGNPTLPGVCMVQIVTELYETATKKQISLKEIKNLKFTNIISPEKTPEFSIILDSQKIEDDELHLKGSIRNESEIFAKFSFLYNIEKQ